MTARAVELATLFVGVPVGLAWARLGGGFDVPVIPFLLAMALVVGWILRRDPTFDARAALAPRLARPEVRRVLARFAVCAVLLTALVAWRLPDRLFDLPRERTGLWAVVMVLYPLLSVVPQELLYRVHFFHRARGLLPDRALPWASAFVFGIAHLLFGHWISVALSTAGGLMFASTYARTRCLWTAALEHALYGQLVFSIGLGRYFYGGTVQALEGI